MEFLDIVGLGHSWAISKSYFQVKLYSGVNIKTINGQDILGAGDLKVDLSTLQLNWTDIQGIPDWILNQELDWNNLINVPGWVINRIVNWGDISGIPDWILNQTIDWNNITGKPDFTNLPDVSQFVKKAGDTMTGNLEMTNGAGMSFVTSGNATAWFDSIFINTDEYRGEMFMQSENGQYLHLTPTGIASYINDPNYVYASNGSIVNIQDLIGQAQVTTLSNTADNMNVTLIAEAGGYSSQTIIEAATTTMAGVMTAEDKRVLENIKNGDMIMVEPTIHPKWSVQEGASTRELTDKDIQVEFGSVVTFNGGTYSWTHVVGRKDPTFIDTQNSDWSDLTASGQESQPLTINNITSNRTIRVRLGAPKTGLMVVGTSVVAAEGNDYTEDTCSVTFAYRIYMGPVTSQNPTAEEIAALESGMITTLDYTKKNVTATTQQYYAIAYPASLGQAETIIQDGAMPVLGAFRSPLTMNVTTQSGSTTSYLVYVSNNLGAFTNVQLEIR